MNIRRDLLTDSEWINLIEELPVLEQTAKILFLEDHFEFFDVRPRILLPRDTKMSWNTTSNRATDVPGYAAGPTRLMSRSTVRLITHRFELEESLTTRYERSGGTSFHLKA